MPVLLVKEIKPQRFNREAFKRAIEAELKAVAQEVKQDFEKTTATWKRKPPFEMVTQASPPTVMVGTDDEVYGYVSKGTKPHPIFAGIYTGKSDKKALAFPARSTPKTRPGWIGSGAGSRSRTKIVRPYVNHPGTKARRFEEVIGKKWKPRFRKRMERAMSRAAKASGHSL